MYQGYYTICCEISKFSEEVLHIKHPQITEIGTGEMYGWTGEKQGKHREFKIDLSGDPV